MKTLKYCTVLMLLFLLAACGHNKDTDGVVTVQDIVLVDKSELYHPVSKLKENINVVGNILSFDFLDKETFVLASSNPSVFIYSTSGEQLKEINRFGRGPYEYQEPAIVRAHDDKIFVWCSQQLKLIVFDSQGNPIVEYKGFSRAIKDFLLYNDNVIFYVSGGFKGPFIEVYSLEEEDFVQGYGETSNEHLVLELLSCSGGMALMDGDLYYASANQLAIDQVDLVNFETTGVKLRDPYFNVEPLDADAHDLINKERAKAINFINKNSVVTGLYATNDNVIIKVEIGEFKMEENRLNNSARFGQYYILDRQSNFEYAFRIEHDLNYNNCLFSAEGDFVYAITADYSGNDFSYVLEKVVLPQ